MRWLVTGSEGFIARNLIPVLEARGDAVDKYDITRADLWEAHGPWDAAVLLGALAGIADCEDHPFRAMATNVASPASLLALLGPQTRVVFASSQAARRPEASQYGATKAALEALCRWHPGATVLRFSNVYGPHSKHKQSAVHRFVRQALAGEPMTVHGRHAVRDFVCVEDVCRAITAAVRAPDPVPGPLDVGSGHQHTVFRVAETIADLVGGGAIQTVLGCDDSPAPCDLVRTYSALGWSPEVTLEEGLRMTIDWYRRQAP
jgi:nucleoside-diphosphate-sugar epimerase